MTASDEMPTLTYEEPPLLGVNTYLRTLQAQRPIWRVRTPAGDEAWLVTRLAVVKQLLVDRKLGRSSPDPDNAPQYIANPMIDLMRGMSDASAEHEVHLQLRTLLAPFFSSRNISALRPRVAAIVDANVERVTAEEPPVDMQAGLSQPLAMQVLGELLGVPESDRAKVPALVHQISDLADMQHAESGKDTLYEYFCRLVEQKRSDPGEDVMSGLAKVGLTDDQAASVGLMLLYAGYGSTASHTTLGIARIASDAELRDELTKKPELMKTAVDEFLRTASPGGFSIPHYAHEDIEICDVTIRAGDLVLLDLALANFDDDAFTEPDRVDITRTPNPHVTFAHGMWHCVGAPLARMQMRMVFNALLARRPNLHLAVPLEEINQPESHLGGALPELLVTW